MIKQRLVTDAVLARLRATGFKVGDGVAPVDAGQQYGVLEPLSFEYDGSPTHPEKTCQITYRVRAVGIDPTLATGRDGPRMDAEALADVFRATMANRAVKLEGTGWRVIRRTLYPGGTDREGPTVNVTDDWELVAVER